MSYGRGMNANLTPVQQMPQQSYFNPQTIGMLANALKQGFGSSQQSQQQMQPDMGGMPQSQPGYGVGQPLVQDGGQMGQSQYAQTPPQPNPNAMPSPLLQAMMKQGQARNTGVY